MESKARYKLLYLVISNSIIETYRALLLFCYLGFGKWVNQLIRKPKVRKFLNENGKEFWDSFKGGSISAAFDWAHQKTKALINNAGAIWNKINNIADKTYLHHVPAIKTKSSMTI